MPLPIDQPPRNLKALSRRAKKRTNPRDCGKPAQGGKIVAAAPHYVAF